MRILILGGDGYLGWPTAMRFSQRGHDVHVVDNYLRRRAHAEAGTDSLTPILPDLTARASVWLEVTGRTIGVTEGDLTDPQFCRSTVDRVVRELGKLDILVSNAAHQNRKQSIEEVTGTLGKPAKIVDLGSKKIYVYRDLKVTFVDGRVQDVQ